MRLRTPPAVRLNVAAEACLYGTSRMVQRTPLALRLNTAATSYLKGTAHAAGRAGECRCHVLQEMEVAVVLNLVVRYPWVRFGVPRPAEQ